jgi:acyl carrier protein
LPTLISQPPDSAAIVQDVLATLWPGRFGGDPPPPHAPLGEGGLGLDSIEIVELVLACEERAGLPSGAAEALLEEGPLTVGRLTAHLDGR